MEEERTKAQVTLGLKFPSLRKPRALSSPGSPQSSPELQKEFFLNEQRAACVPPALCLDLCSFPSPLGTPEAKDGKGVGGLHPGLHKPGF